MTSAPPLSQPVEHTPTGLTTQAVQTLTDTASVPCVPSTAQVSSAVAGLRTAVVEQKDALHAFMTGSRDLVSRHLDETDRLKQDSIAVQRAVESVSNDFDPRNPKDVTGVADFMKLAALRSTSGHDQAIGATTLASLKDIQRQYEDLSKVEDAIWSGRSTDDFVLNSFQTMMSVAASETPSKVGAAIKSRVALLRSTVSDQLSKAWGLAVTVGIVGTVPTIAVKRKLRLQLPTISRATTSNVDAAPSAPPSYHVSDIALAMSQLGVLSAHLQGLHTLVVRELVDVLLSEPETQASVSEDNDSARVRVISGSDQGPEDTVQSIKTVLSFVRGTICSTAAPETETFILNLQQDAFARILTSVVIPSMPSTCALLPDWLRLVRQCSALEAQLTTGTSQGVLAQFAETGAGQKWLAKFRHARLQGARQLSFKTWSKMPVKEVELSQEANAPPPAQPEIVPIPIVVDSVDDDANGWGFDDEPTPSQPSQPPQPAAAAVDEDSGGWDFDDDMDAAPAPAPAPIQPKPPVREAKRLGKRGLRSGDRGSTRSSTSPSPSPPPPPPPPAPAKKVRQRSNVIPPPVPPQRKVCRVSEACDTVLRLPSEVLKEVEVMKQLGEATFHGVAREMTDVLTEEMDFICATTPVAQQSGGTVPLVVALQLSNDYAYIASKLATSEPSSVWTAQTLCAQRFKAASDLWRNVCVEEQFVGLASVLDGARHFVDMSHDSFYHQAEDSVRTAVSQLETTAADTKSVLVNDQYFILLGSLVESVVTRLLDDIVALDDITEVESERISSILSLVETLDHLFQSPLGDVSTIAAHVPHWLKFCYLKEILHANLVDITYLFESDSLVDFKPAELCKLVQALFADSAKRSALLEKIG